MRPVVIVFYFQPFNFDGHYIYFKGFFSHLAESERENEREREKERKINL